MVSRISFYVSKSNRIIIIYSLLRSQRLYRSDSCGRDGWDESGDGACDDDGDGGADTGADAHRRVHKHGGFKQSGIYGGVADKMCIRDRSD